MDLNRVAVFVKVVETASFTAAANALGMPKSSVSRSVSNLEDDLGVRLLQRTTRTLSLTDAGRAYFARARESLSGLDDATTAVKDMGKEPRGVVRVTAPVDMGVAVLGEIVSRFVLRYPHIRVDLSLTARRVDLVEEGFDLALRAGKLEDSSLIARPITFGTSGLFASPAYLKRRGRPKRVEDLASHDCILFRARDGKLTWRLTSAASGDEDVDVTGPVTVDDFSFVQIVVTAGVGIGVVPTLFCVGAVERGELVRVLPEHEQRGIGRLHLVSPSTRYEPARVTLFRDFVLDGFKAMGAT